MADSAQNESPTTPKRQVVRRKLVQTTLFPLKPQQQLEVNGDLKAARGNAGDDEYGDDEDFCGSQSKTKRKSKGKKTPPIKAPKKDGKRSRNSTPKKKINGTEVESEDAPRVVTDLRLEARLKAEETSRIFSGMFSGKQIHPFFSICKAGKRKREATEVDGDLSYVGRKDKEITSGPIHVFERTQDDAVFLDWRNWTFCEDTFMKSGPDMECTSSSIFEGSVECLNFEKLPIVFQPCKLSTFQNVVSLDQHCIQQEFAHDISPTVPGFLVDEQLMHYQQSKEVEDNEMLKVDLLSQHTTYIKKSDIEQQKILEERLMSNYSSCGNQPTNSLWTYKYRPMKAIDVCGNHESVNFLSEWLRLWYERDFRANRDLTRCSQSGSDLESEDEEASMKKNNVLLVTGPTGSGKSAAIYACAQEQGFKVLELSASECRNGALVKQRFGEALKSRNFRRSVANPEGSQNKSIVKSLFVDANGMTDHEMADDVIELIAVSDEDSHEATETSVKSVSKEDYSEVKHLILFDDVDIIFLEDRGFIAAIQQIAKTAKGPIILTSNSDNPVLPDSFDRLQVRFTLPSQKELHSLAYMVSASERANIQPLLLERLIECCRGDIRKIFMHLQFWCQGGSFRKDTKMREWYGSLLFDVEAGHLMLPNMLPWDLPSQLSDVVEKEITKALYMMEESPRSMDVIEENLHEIEVQYSMDMPCNGMESLEALGKRENPMPPKGKDKQRAAASPQQPPPSLEDLFSSLNKHIEESEFENAVKVADQVLSINRGDEDALRCKVVALIKADDIDAALSTIRSSKSPPADFSFFEAYCLYRNNKLDEALESLKRQERDSVTMILESQILFRSGKMDACIDIYQNLPKPKVELLEINSAASLVAAGRASEVKRTLEALGVKATNSFMLAFNTACSLIQLQKYTEAEQLLLKARRIGQEELFSDNVPEDEIQIELAPIAVQLAYVQQLLGQKQEAVEAYTDIIKQDMADEVSLGVAVNNLIALRGPRDVSDGLKKLDRLKDKDKQNFHLTPGLDNKLSPKQKESIYVNRVLLLLHANKMDQAREIVAALPDMFPDSVMPVLLQAAVFVRENRAGKAEEILGQFSEKFPDKSKVVLLARAQVAAAAGHPLIAAESLGKIPDIQHTPATVATLVSLRERAGDIDGAAAVLDAAINWWSNAMTEDNKLSVLMQEAASFKLRHGREEEAARLYEELVKSHGSVEALVGLVTTVARVDVKKAEAYEQKLKPLPGLKGVNVDSLEKTSGAKHNEGVSHVKITETYDEGKTKAKAKRKRKRKPKYPKGFDPANPGPPPDPERWLPKRERSSYRPKRKDKRAAQVRGSQGSVARDKHETGAASNTSNTKSNQAATSKGASQNAVAEPSKPSSSKSRKKSRN